jgi:hypothetical protein
VGRAQFGRSRAVFDGYRVAFSGWRAPEIMTSIEIIVFISSLACPPRRNLTMPHDDFHDDCSVRLGRNRRQLDLRDRRSQIQIVQQN